MRYSVTLLVLLGFTLVGRSQEVGLKAFPPVVIKTVPTAGSDNVSADLKEIKVTFSKDMMDNTWSWIQLTQGSFPEITGKPRYLNDNRTCVLPVKLKPGKTYALWLNTSKFTSFRDLDGKSAVPYLLTFRVKKAKKAGPQDILFFGNEEGQTSKVRVTEAKVSKVPDAVRKQFQLSKFYAKYTQVTGFPIVSSDKVADEALREAARIVNHMLGKRPDVLKAMAKNNVRLAIMAPTEMTTDIPEHSDLKPKKYWDVRARGLGATRTRPAVSCGEENLLNYPGDRYSTENILVHEFAHAIHQMGLNSLNRRFDARLRETYRKAKERGLWKNTYAMTNHAEYWAEGVQSYFDTNRPRPDAQHNHIDTREELKEYDPLLFEMIDEAFRKPKWRYVRFDKRFPQRARELAKLAREKVNNGPSVPREFRLTIQNKTAVAATIYWLPERGKPKRYIEVQPGKTARLITFAGHRWRAVLPDRKTFPEHTATKKQKVWTIR